MRDLKWSGGNRWFHSGAWGIQGGLFWLPLETDILPSFGRLVLGPGTHTRGSSASYVDASTGLIKTALTDIPRFEHVGGHRAILIEPGATNNLLHARDLTDAVWVETNCTAAKDQVGEDGVINSASSFLATAANATVLQTLVLANADYAYSVSIKRITGTGNIEVTDDNGGTWTDIKAYLSTTAWYRHTITRGQANPICGIRIAIDTDKIAVDYNQLEAGKVGTSRIATSGATATRATESDRPYWTDPSGLFSAKGTVVVWVRFGYAHSDHGDGAYGLVSVSPSAQSLLGDRKAGGVPKIRSYDGTTAADRTLYFAANTWYKLAVKWGYSGKYRTGRDTGSGIGWGAEANFDGAFAADGHIRLGYGLFGPLWFRDLRFYNRVLSDTEINALGSP